MIGKKVTTVLENYYGNAKILPVGSSGEIIRRGPDGWILKLDSGQEMWCQEEEIGLQKIDEQEVKAMAFLLERRYGFDQYAEIRAYKSDATNLVNGQHHGFIVHYDIKFDPKQNYNEMDFKEKAFKTAGEAAWFYIQYMKENKLD